MQTWLDIVQAQVAAGAAAGLQAQAQAQPNMMAQAMPGQMQNMNMMALLQAQAAQAAAAQAAAGQAPAAPAAPGPAPMGPANTIAQVQAQQMMLAAQAHNDGKDGGKGGGKGSKYDGEGEPSDNLYVMGLPKEFDSGAVEQFFGALGKVEQCRSFGNGYALVRFDTKETATVVKNSLHNQKPVGCEKPLTITFALGKKSDWYCPKCGDLQFQKNAICRLCGTPKDETAIPAEGSTHPAFGKAKGKGKFGDDKGPYGKGKSKDKDDGKGSKGGPMCSVAEFINELITGGIPGGDQNPELNCLFVGGLPSDTKPESLYQIFATFGPIIPRGTRIETNGSEECSGSGYVSFLESASADMAVLALNGIQLSSGQTLQVRQKNAAPATV